MKKTFKSWRGFLTESVEKGKKFEVVVVQVVRLNAGAEVLTGPGYDSWEEWSELASKNKTLGEMAQELYETAKDSGFFTASDFKNAKMQDIGKQKYAGQGKPIEIKTDVMFGNKAISIKMPGDTQADSSGVAGIVTRIGLVVNNLIEEIEDDVVFENFQEAYEEAFTEEVKNKIIKASETRYLTDKRVKTLTKRIETAEGTKKKVYQDVLEALKLENIIDENYKIIDEELRFDPKEITSDIEEAIKSTITENGLLNSLMKELLTGSIGFRDIPGAAAEYLLSPEYAFDLGDENTIEILTNAIKMRISLKGGRRLNIESIDSIKKDMGSEISIRWDIKKQNLIDAIEAAKATAASAITSAAKSHEQELNEQASKDEKGFEEIYDEIQDIMLATIEKNKA